MTLQHDIGLLARIPLFAQLEPDALRALVLTAQKRVLRKGEALFAKGDKSDGGYLLLEGMLRMAAAADHLKMVRPPSLIGETALLIETVRPASAFACEPSSVLRIPRDTFRRALLQSASSAERVRALILHRVIDLGVETEQLALRLAPRSENIDFRAARD